MPSRLVYSVDFANGLEPTLNVLNWPPMTTSLSNGGTNGPGGEGLTLTAKRPDGISAQVSSSVYVIPNRLPVDSRVAMRLVFDLPFAVGTFDDKNPWAVGLRVKKVAEMDAPKEPEVVVTCQFRTADGQTGVGIRLNTPGALQTDAMSTATNLVSAPHYDQWAHNKQGRPDAFVLEFLFCGAGAPSLGHAVGYGSLRIGGESDERVLSHASLWPKPTIVETTKVAHGPWIGALGASVVIASPMGGMPPLPGTHLARARFLTFSIALWPRDEAIPPPTIT